MLITMNFCQQTTDFRSVVSSLAAISYSHTTWLLIFLMELWHTVYFQQTLPIKQCLVMLEILNISRGKKRSVPHLPHLPGEKQKFTEVIIQLSYNHISYKPKTFCTSSLLIGLFSFPGSSETGVKSNLSKNYNLVLYINVKRKPRKVKWLKMGEKCDTYLTHVCRQPQSIESSERTDRKQEHFH